MAEEVHLGPGDEDGDLVQGPHHCPGARRGGEAAVVTVILAHVVFRQKVQERERLDFGALALEN